jgi:hypothetical protein
MAVIACPACGTAVNDEATACPACGADPRMAPDVARSWLAEQQAAERSQDVRKAVLADPVGIARRAAEAGLPWLQIELPYDAMMAALAAALGLGEPPDHDKASVLESIEAQGWRLLQVEHVFRPTVVQSSMLRGATPFLGTEPVEGELQHFYLFRRADSLGG